MLILTLSWKSAIETLTKLSSIPLSRLSLPSSFAPDPSLKPYFPRNVRHSCSIDAYNTDVKHSGQLATTCICRAVQGKVKGHWCVMRERAGSTSDGSIRRGGDR